MSENEENPEDLNPCVACSKPADWFKHFCWECAPDFSGGGRNELSRARHRGRGRMPRRRRKKRLHKKLAKRGFAVSSRWIYCS